MLHLLLSTHLLTQLPQLLPVKLVAALQLRGSRRIPVLCGGVVTRIQPRLLRRVVPAEDSGANIEAFGEHFQINTW